MVTPQISHEKLAKKLGLSGPLYLKREDLHPLRSHKGRSIPRMIEKYAKAGARDFAISSSGNAGIAAAMYCYQYNVAHPDAALRLKIYIGRNIPDEKRRILSEHSTSAIQITQVDRPLQAFLQAIKDPSVTGLRQSTDDTALEGYVELARELAKIPELSAVFMPASSGTGAQGLHEGFKKIFSQDKAGAALPQMHIIQTDACHPIADIVGTSGGQGRLSGDTASETADKSRAIVSPKTQGSIADAIVDTIGHRKEILSQDVKESGGAGWIVSNDEIAKAVELLREDGVLASANGALAVAGLRKALGAGWKWNGPVVCVICGK